MVVELAHFPTRHHSCYKPLIKHTKSHVLPFKAGILDTKRIHTYKSCSFISKFYTSIVSA